jgi:hypothetical protein
LIDENNYVFLVVKEKSWSEVYFVVWYQGLVSWLRAAAWQNSSGF